MTAPAGTTDRVRPSHGHRTPPAPPAVDGVSVGCDVVEVTRLAGLLARRPGARDRLFTPAEQADAVRDGVAPDDPVAVRRLAARFAAKEAVVKLLGRPRMQWTDVEVATGADGAPHLHLHGRFVPIAVSLSHDGATAMAVVAATSPSPDADGGPPRTSRHGDAPHHPCCGAAAPHGTRPHRPTTRTTTGS